MPYKTSLGLPENIVAALSYTVGWVSGFIFLLLERKNKFVRFHAMQSVLIFLPVVLIIFLMGWIPYVGWFFADGAGMGAMLLLVIPMYMAYRGSKFKIPIIGKIAYEFAYGE
ncbi:hypothetical protein FTO70_11515 [Methanosarcina sp. KYL-1]|uniref:DUF4870 domain-containing protein n=1 Tax=Methanosarcina sp. KYL-1 TaxID=2602068 RepID=UPI002100DDAD|nr:DUF4870 domain-containing protein [Methanosarcina sp. KYL-1]MCQ1536295.1 hypothetical protein [Methanosarcina sp. KYL-1]